MTKKIPITLFLTVVIGIVGLLAVNGVMAQERPVICEAGSYTITPATDVDFPFFEQGASDGSGYCGTFDCYVWRYKVTAGERLMAKVNMFHVFIPSSPPNIIEAADIENYADHIRWRGEGGISSFFGDDNYNGIVISATPHSGSGTERTFEIATKSVSTYGVVSVVVSTGKGGEFGCVALDANGIPWIDVQGPVGGIVGPGFDISGFVAVADFQDINLPEGGCVRVKRHPVTGCIQNFKYCNGTDIPATSTRPDWLKEDIADFGDPTNLRCRGGMITTSGSPYVYWGWTPPNNYYCIGVYDPAVPSWRTTPCP